MSGHVINDYSFNVLGGYSLGVKRFEFGGVFNLVGGNVNGVQVAGLFNANYGKMSGLQFGGVFNLNRDTTLAAQFAGVLNINLKSTRIVSAAGVLNINLQGAEGVQLAGVGNLTIGEQQGLQLAGVYNVSTGNVNGTQVSPVLNVTRKDIKGAQVSALINYARRVDGTQLALINITDSIKGVPVGFLSIVWKGYHKVEFSADEVFYNNISFRTGVRQFHNIFTAGARPSTYGKHETFWTFGYCIGTAPKLSRKLFLNFDVTANQIVEGNSIKAVNLLNKLYVGLDYQAFRKISFILGATLNGYLTKNSYEVYPSLFTDFQPDIFYDRDIGSDHNMKMWLGAKVGVRFL